MRCTAAGSRCGPTSFSSSLRIGVFGRPASPSPIRPPIDVPNQSTVSTFSRAISVTMSATYCGTHVEAGVGEPDRQAPPRRHPDTPRGKCRQIPPRGGRNRALSESGRARTAARADWPGRPTRCRRCGASHRRSRTARSVGAARAARRWKRTWLRSSGFLAKALRIWLGHSRDRYASNLQTIVNRFAARQASAERHRTARHEVLRSQAKRARLTPRPPRNRLAAACRSHQPDRPQHRPRPA